MMNLVPSIPAFSKTFSFPEESSITPAHAIRVNVSDDSEIAVDAWTCLVKDSTMVGDLSQHHNEMATVDIIPEHPVHRGST
jgi:hypothetical protein